MHTQVACVWLVSKQVDWHAYIQHCTVWHVCTLCKQSHKHERAHAHKHAHARACKRTRCIVTLCAGANCLSGAFCFAIMCFLPLLPCLNGDTVQHPVCERVHECLCKWACVRVQACMPFQSPHLDAHKNACPERVLLLMWLFYGCFHIWADSIFYSAASLANSFDHAICLSLSFRNAWAHSNLNTACVYTRSLVKHWAC